MSLVVRTALGEYTEGSIVGQQLVDGIEDHGLVDLGEDLYGAASLGTDCDERRGTKR